MNLIANERTKRLVNHLVTLNRALAIKLMRNDQRREMDIVVAFDLHRRAIKSGFNQWCYFYWAHFECNL